MSNPSTHMCINNHEKYSNGGTVQALHNKEK